MEKDYIEINQKIDEKAILDMRKRIAELQDVGSYPKSYDFPITLQFELTGQCNLACKHCYNRSGDIDRKTIMTPDKWCELSKQIVKSGGIFQCIISGGEPLLLGNALFDIMDILHDDGTSFVVITNGYLLDKNKVKRFSKYRYFWFQISIDGYEHNIHDRFRGVEGSWERAVNGALEISNAGIPLTIAHSVIPESLPHLEKMVKLAYSLGANTVILGEVFPSGRAYENASEILLNHAQKNYLYKSIQELSSKYSGIINIKRSTSVQVQLKRYSEEVNAGGIIRPNGDFRLDCMAPFVIGNVTESSIKDIWLSKGKNAWKNPRVVEYINSIDSEKQQGNWINHVDDDIVL